MKNDYTKLDAAILARINEFGPITFGLISCHSRVSGEAVKFQSAFKPAWRYVEARLQTLRRAGKIEYQKRPEGWVIKEKKVTI